MKETIKIGRREVGYNDFIKAVERSKKFTEVADALEFNSKVATTINLIKEAIEQLELDIKHFEYKYTKSENFNQLMQKRVKVFNISEVNNQYYNSFIESLKEPSRPTYKASTGNFLEYLSNTDFATITPEAIESYVGDKKNALAHIRSMMIYVVKNDISGAKDKVLKDMLIWLI